MVVEEIFHALPIPDMRPAQANPEHRAKRKQYEKEHPHFKMQEFGLKAGVLALMGALTLYPWEKKYDEHVEKHHPERLEENKKEKGEGNGGKERRKSVSEGSRRDDSVRERRSVDGRRRGFNDEGSVRGSADGGRRNRRQSVAEGSSRRQRGFIEDGSRRGSIGPGPDRRSRRAYPAVDDLRPQPRRRSVDPTALRLAVADGYEYIPPHKAERRSVDDWDTSPRTIYDDGYAFRPRRVATDDRRMR